MNEDNSYENKIIEKAEEIIDRLANLTDKSGDIINDYRKEKYEWTN